jgi:hypothetical protein
MCLSQQNLEPCQEVVVDGLLTVDGQLFVEARTTREVAEALQLQPRPNHDSYDVVIVGAGPMPATSALRQALSHRRSVLAPPLLHALRYGVPRDASHQTRHCPE